MNRIPVLVAGMVALLGSAAMAQPSDAPPPPQASAQNQNTDLDCRRQAAAQSGYHGDGNTNGAPSDAERRYADAYYACMDQAYGPPAPSGYGYGPPPPSGYAYGPPPPYYYGPYPYPYYYPPYYGPGLSFGFGFGGFHGHRR